MFKRKASSTEKRPPTGNIAAVKKRLVFTFARIAISVSMVVFFAFSVQLILEEDFQIEEHLVSFNEIAQKYYQLEQVDKAILSTNVTAHYTATSLPEVLKEEMPYALGEVTRIRSFEEGGYMVFYTQFVYQGRTIPLYLAVDARSLEFGDDNWGGLMITSTLLMLFLVWFLSFSIKRVFDGLMSPISELSEQLSQKGNDQFSVDEYAIDEIKQLTNHLNSYTQMKERVVKQEMMFAKYASHELKTPIAIISGAANLQAMKEDDAAFQAKQRQRIVGAVDNMQSTVEILLNIVKQENATTSDELWEIHDQTISVTELSKKAEAGVEVTLVIEPNTKLNFSPSVLKMILKNLVNNSIRFTEEGSISIHISNDRIAVKDSGVGLSDENETEHGLGLLIVRRLCHVYGWEFELKDNKDEHGCIAKLVRL